MDASPPVGSPPATLPCGPCGGEPTNCLVDVQTLHKQYCDLNTNYQSVLQKLATVRASLASKGLEINDLINDIAQIQKQLDDINGTDCSRLGASTTPDALIVCEGGIQKNFAAPSNDGFSLVSKGAKWEAFTLGQTFFPVGGLLISNAGASNPVVTFPGYPSGGTRATVTGVFVSDVFVTNGVGSGQLLLNGQTLNLKRAFGGNGDGNYLYSLAPINPTETFNVISVGGAALNVDLQLLGYLAKVL